MVADAAGMDRATALFHDPKNPTHRENLDSWLASPVDPRQAQAERNLRLYLTPEGES